MNVFLLIAATVLFLIGVMHSVVAEWKGERKLVWRITQLTLFESNDAKDLLAKRIVRLAWHLTSLVWCGIAAVLAYIAFVEASGSIIVIVRILSSPSCSTRRCPWPSCAEGTPRGSDS